jgi:hypothetical protein
LTKQAWPPLKWSEPNGKRIVRLILKAGSEYFAAVFAAGFVMGTIRTILVAPNIGEVPAVLAEIPLMLLLSWIACKFVMGRYPQIKTAQAALAVGGLALTLLLFAEALLSVTLGGISLGEHFALYQEPPAQIGLLAQFVFALLPFLSVRMKDRSEAHPPRK